jgi:hypothetical protein
MKALALLTVLAASVLAFGQKFEVTDLSVTSTPIVFDGMAKVSKAGTICTVTMRNNSTQSLLALEVTGEVTSPWGWMQTTELSYDGFFKENGFPPGETFDLVGPDLFNYINHGRSYENGVLVKPQEPKQDLVCQASFKVQFVQLEDGSKLGDYQIEQQMEAKRAKRIAILSHLVEAYDIGGEAGFDGAFAALNEPESRPVADVLKAEAEYRKVSLIDLARRKLAAAQNRQASGIF